MHQRTHQRFALAVRPDAPHTGALHRCDLPFAAARRGRADGAVQRLVEGIARLRRIHLPAQLEQRLRAGAIHLHRDWRQRLKKALNPRDYYLSEEGIVFFLPMHSVSEGIPTFTIPWRSSAP